ncbi:DJ-1/PfpI family protein [Fredinandcohnia sp. 179-A 10B2 NHS]|uniref:DJ-1/PfpI family protein n=1 Tax=Fredinandcohnia sp. 179-A 10B2 NHS TaxID=3235176 RepID=UPI00399EF2F9
MDILDFAGPAEVLSLTSNNKTEQTLTLYKKHLLPTRPFKVFTLSETGLEIKTHSGVKVVPDYSIAESPEIDILIVPGGPLRAVQSMAKNQKIIKWIAKHKSIEYICSVCTGAYILGETGLLNGKKVTTHHLALKLLQDKYPETQVLSERKVVQDGNIITSGGVSSGINLALHIVEQLLGETTAERTAKTIEFSI